MIFSTLHLLLISIEVSDVEFSYDELLFVDELASYNALGVVVVFLKSL